MFSFANIDRRSPINWKHPLCGGIVAWFISVPWRGTNAKWIDLTGQHTLSPSNGPTWTDHGPINPSGGAVGFNPTMPGLRDTALTSAGTQQWTNTTLANVLGGLPKATMISSLAKNSGNYVFAGWMETYNAQFGLYLFTSNIIYFLASNGNSFAADQRYTASSNNGDFRLCASYNGGLTGAARTAGYTNGQKQTLTQPFGNGDPGATLASAANLSTFRIGRATADGVWSDGNVNNIILYANRSLSAQEVALEYSEFSRGYPGMLNRVKPTRFGKSAATLLLMRRRRQLINS